MSYQAMEKALRDLQDVLQRSQSVKFMYFVIPTICHFGKDKTIDTVKNLAVARHLKAGRVELESTEEFKPSETIVYDTIIVDTCHDISFKTHITYNSKGGS